MRYMSDQEQDYFRSRTLGWLDPFSIFSIEPIDQFLEDEELDAQQRNRDNNCADYSPRPLRWLAHDD